MSADEEHIYALTPLPRRSGRGRDCLSLPASRKKRAATSSGKCSTKEQNKTVTDFTHKIENTTQQLRRATKSDAKLHRQTTRPRTLPQAAGITRRCKNYSRSWNLKNKTKENTEERANVYTHIPAPQDQIASQHKLEKQTAEWTHNLSPK